MSEQVTEAIVFERRGDKAFGRATVTAKQCLWFAWAPSTEAGVEGETLSGNTYRPYVIDVTDVHEVSITVESGSWAHNPSNFSGADGINDVRGLENPGYRSDRLNSSHIVPLSARLNSLVALQGFAAAPTSPKPQEVVGSAPLIIGNGHDRLFLGFHDGRQWTNNSGSVSVTVTLTYKKK